MKSILSIVMLLLSVALHAQEKDVTKFLGIPVDGTKSEMIKKLKDKGFESNNPIDKSILSGEFNGSDVNLSVTTNNNKVCRIMVIDAYGTTDVTNIKIRFNSLCRLFQNSPKYIAASDVSDYIISDDEDIAYEMLVNNKRYEAIFCQLSIQADSIIKKSKSISEASKVRNEMIKSICASDSIDIIDIDKLNIMMEENNKALVSTLEILNRPVWFTIIQGSGRYYISLYYDNEYNMANGEDL